MVVAHDAVCGVGEEQRQGLGSYAAVLEDLVAQVLVEQRIAIQTPESHSLEGWRCLSILAGLNVLSTLSRLDLLRSMFEKHFNRAFTSCRLFRLRSPFVSIRCIAVCNVNVAFRLIDRELVVFRNVGRLRRKISLVADQSGDVLKKGSETPKFMSTPSTHTSTRETGTAYYLYFVERGDGDESLLKQRTARRKRKRKYTVQSGFTSSTLLCGNPRGSEKYNSYLLFADKLAQLLMKK